MRKQAWRMTLLGMTTLAALQAMAQASSAPGKPTSPQPDNKAPSKATGAVTPMSATVVPAPMHRVSAPDTAAKPAFSNVPSPRAVSPAPAPPVPAFSASPTPASPVPVSPAPASTAVPGAKVPTASSKPASSSKPAPSSASGPSSAASAPSVPTSSVPAPSVPVIPTRPVPSAQAARRAESHAASAPPVAVERPETSAAPIAPSARAATVFEATSELATSELATSELIGGEDVGLRSATDRPSLQYQIQSGDTLQTIATALDISVDALTDANDITETTVIIAGDVLRVPDATVRETPAGMALKADFSALQAAMEGPSEEGDIAEVPESEVPESGAAAVDVAVIGVTTADVMVPEVLPGNASEPAAEVRLTHLRSTALRSIDRAALLQQLRPDAALLADDDVSATVISTAVAPAEEGMPESWLTARRAEANPLDTADTVSGEPDETTVERQAEALVAALSGGLSEDLSEIRETPMAESSDEYTDRLLASLQAPVTVVESEPVEAVVVARSVSNRAAAARPAAARMASAPSRNTVIAPRSTPGRSVNVNEPVLPDRENYLPRSTDAMDGYIWPTRGVISSGYGWRWGRMHRGVDIAAPTGTPIVASASGVVEHAGWNSGGYGNLVDIRHADGSLTRYAHNSRVHVAVGQQVQQGELISEMGSTGYSTGPHLHFELHQPLEGTVNPMAFMPDQQALLP